MRLAFLFSILPTLAVSAALPLTIIPTGQTIKQDVLNIHNAVLGLDRSVQSFTGGKPATTLIDGVTVLFGVSDIHFVNRAGYAHALTAPPFSLSDSEDVVNAVIDTVNVSIPAATQHLKEKAPAFKEAGFTQTVIASLQLLGYDHDTFSEVVLEKINPGLDAGKAADGVAAVKNIHDVIQDAVAFYQAL